METKDFLTRYGADTVKFVSSYKHVFVYQNDTLRISGHASFAGDFKPSMHASELLAQLRTYTFTVGEFTIDGSNDVYRAWSPDASKSIRFSGRFLITKGEKWIRFKNQMLRKLGLHWTFELTANTELVETDIMEEIITGDNFEAQFKLLPYSRASQKQTEK